MNNIQAMIQGSCALSLQIPEVLQIVKPTYEVGQVVWVLPGESRTYGMEMRSNRPGVVLAKHGDDKLTIAYLTTSRLQSKKHRFNVDVISKGEQAVARCDKISTIHISRVSGIIGGLSVREMFEIHRVVTALLQKNTYIEKFRESTEDLYDGFCMRGHAYRIKSTSDTVTGTELGQNPFGLVVCNPVFRGAKGDAKEMDTLIVSFGITEEEYRKANNRKCYVCCYIYNHKVKDRVPYYFNTYELYEVDRKRIDSQNVKSHVGRLHDIEMTKLNSNIKKLTSGLIM